MTTGSSARSRFRSRRHPASSKTHFRINCRFSLFSVSFSRFPRPLKSLLRGPFRERLNIISRTALHVNTFFEIFFTIFDLFCFHEHSLPSPILAFINSSDYRLFRLSKRSVFKRTGVLFSPLKNPPGRQSAGRVLAALALLKCVFQHHFSADGYISA